MTEPDPLGRFTALATRFDVVDLNGVVLVSGSIPDGTLVLLSTYHHSSLRHEKPVGMGELSTHGNRLILRGRFDVHTPRGKWAHGLLCRLGDRARWSITWESTESEYTWEWRDGRAVKIVTRCRPWEASPVANSACPGTRTLSLAGHARDEQVAALVRTPTLSQVA